MSWLEEKTQDLLMIGILFGAFGWLIVAPRVFPAPLGEAIAQVGYFVIVVGGVFGTDLVIQFYVNKWAYLEVLIRPRNRIVGLFLRDRESKLLDEGSGSYSTTLTVAFPVRLGEGDKVRQVILNHVGSWEDRIGFKSGGYARFNGYSVAHPQTERIEVYQEERGSVSIDHGEAIPVFTLRTASKDYTRRLTQPEADVKATVESLTARLASLSGEMGELQRKSGEWHQKAIAYEDIIKQQGSETKGLLEGKTGVQELAYEYLLTVYMACGSIDKALSQLKGGRLEWFNKYALYAVLGGVFFAYVWFNPSAAAAIQAWFSVSTNQLFVLIFVGLGVAGFYLRSRRR